jgi:hypothetical protein
MPDPILSLTQSAEAIARAARLIGSGECQLSGQVGMSDATYIARLVKEFRDRLQDFGDAVLASIENQTADSDDWDEIESALVARAEQNETRLPNFMADTRTSYRRAQGY